MKLPTLGLIGICTSVLPATAAWAHPIPTVGSTTSSVIYSQTYPVSYPWGAYPGVHRSVYPYSGTVHHRQHIRRYPSPATFPNIVYPAPLVSPTLGPLPVIERPVRATRSNSSTITFPPVNVYPSARYRRHPFPNYVRPSVIYVTPSSVPSGYPYTIHYPVSPYFGY